MKRLLISPLRWALRVIARRILARFRPGIVGVTGSVGKTSTKRAIAAVLGSERRVRFSEESFNNEFGLPLTIIGEWSDKELKLVSKEEPPGVRILEKIFFWLKVLRLGISRAFFGGSSEYPEILVLEYGADKPGDINELVSIAPPSIGVITAVGEIPVHVEFYAGPEEVAREKGKLIEALPPTGFAILNADDETVTNLKDRTRAHVVTYGFTGEAEVRLLRFENLVEEGAPAGVAVRVEYAGSGVAVRLRGIFGKVQAYAAGAAAAVGVVFGMNLAKIAEALKAYAPAPHRMNLKKGVRESLVIDDCYNASPLSMCAALDTLRALPAKRKIAVVGDMLEIGKYAMQAHEAVGRLAAKVADVLVTVGPHAKLAADAARKSGLGKKDVVSFDEVDEAADAVEGLIKKGDLVLVKGSRAVHLEKIVEAITLDVAAAADD